MAWPAEAQWQVPNYSIPLGRGAGTGFHSVGPCAANSLIVGQGSSSDPACQAFSTLGLAIAAPKITTYINPGALAHGVTTGATLLEVWIWGAGGGGSGNNASNTIGAAQYGLRGGDSSFGTRAPATVTMDASTDAVTWSNHGLVAGQPIYFTTTGTLLSPLVANTVYYVYQTDITTHTFKVSVQPVQTQSVQSVIDLTGSQSGTHSGVASIYTAKGGFPGGSHGDQGPSNDFINCGTYIDPAIGYITSYGWQGGSGSAIYGNNIAGGHGGVNIFGSIAGSGIGDPGIGGGNNTGAGGAGAGATPTSSGGTGGAAGSVCRIFIKPTAATYWYMVGAGGTKGPAGSTTATITIASPGVVTITNHEFGTNAQIKFTTTGSLPTGITAGTTYYVYGPSITDDTFQFSTSPGGTPVNTSGSQSGTHSVTSGTTGADGAGGGVMIIEYFGLSFLMLPDDDGRLVPANDNFYSNSKAA